MPAHRVAHVVAILAPVRDLIAAKSSERKAA
jgi:hypothetical protein